MKHKLIYNKLGKPWRLQPVWWTTCMRYILYDILGKANFQRQEKYQWLPTVWGMRGAKKKRNRQKGTFSAIKLFFNGTVINTWHYVFVKIRWSLQHEEWTIIENLVTILALVHNFNKCTIIPRKMLMEKLYYI